MRLNFKNCCSDDLKKKEKKKKDCRKCLLNGPICLSDNKPRPQFSVSDRILSERFDKPKRPFYTQEFYLRKHICQADLIV